MKPVVETLLDLVRIPSVSSMPNRAVVEYASRALEQAGWNTQSMAYRDTAGVEKLNLIAAPPGDEIDESNIDLAFVCHTDTVPFAENWLRAVDPFLEEGRLHGCGACDVKGFLAALLTAVCRSGSTQFNQRLRLILTADEEVGCIGASRLLAERRIRPKRVVIGEPTSLHPARAGKGYCLAEIVVTGQEAHSAHPDEGASAINGAARLICGIEEIGTQLSGDVNSFFNPGFTTVNVGTIEGGTAKNVVAGQCRFLLEWRPLPGQAPEDVPARIEKKAHILQTLTPRLRYGIKVLRKQAGFETPNDAAVVRAIEKETGRPAISIPFGSEAPLFAQVADEVVVFGPGDMRTAHSERECVPVAELEAAVRCLESLMRC